jgi:HK97 family phage prohead protease
MNVVLSTPFEADVLLKGVTEKEKRFLEGFASTQDLDKEYDIIERDALKEAAKDLLANPTVLYEHKHPIGKVVDVEVKNEGLWVKVQLAQAEEGAPGPLLAYAEDVWQLVQQGVLVKFSIRGEVLEARKAYSKEHGRIVTYVTRLRLYEVSVVPVASNEKARILQYYISKALKDWKGGEEMAEEKAQKPVEEKKENEKKETVAKQEGEIEIEEFDEVEEDELEKQRAYYPYPYPYPRPDLRAISDRLDALEKTVAALEKRVATLEQAKKEAEIREGEEESKSVERENEAVEKLVGETMELKKGVDELRKLITEELPIRKGLEIPTTESPRDTKDFRESEAYKKADPTERLHMALRQAGI